jgi:1,4-dihydroxy-2-naphthoate octaprenyltransferase
VVEVSDRENLTSPDVFLVVAIYFIGVIVVVMSGLSGKLLGIAVGFLLMVVAYLYERVSILEEQVEGGI